MFVEVQLFRSKAVMQDTKIRYRRDDSVMIWVTGTWECQKSSSRSITGNQLRHYQHLGGKRKKANCESEMKMSRRHSWMQVSLQQYLLESWEKSRSGEKHVLPDCVGQMGNEESGFSYVQNTFQEHCKVRALPWIKFHKTSGKVKDKVAMGNWFRRESHV